MAEHVFENSQLQHNQTVRRFTLSCDTFGGYSTLIDVSRVASNEDVVSQVIDRLKDHLTAGKLHVLVDKLDAMKASYHIHDYSFNYIADNVAEYYVCNHNCQSA